jgi:arylsulfatase A-like enzyme
MNSDTGVATKAGTIGTSTAHPAHRASLLSLLALSAWSGLVAGLLEVGTFVLRKQFFDSDQLYKVSRNFIWLVPLSNLAVSLLLGFLGCALVLIWPHRGRWLYLRLTGALVFLPSLLVAFPRIYSLALLIVAVGLAARLVPMLERVRRGFRRIAAITLPAAAAIVALLGTSLWVRELSAERRENERSLPPPGSPNVLLVVLDTVAARHMSLYGYDRATSTTTSELAERGILFNSARAASSWTLPSHASMFTGRWFHELSVGWFTPLDKSHPTLAEFLGGRGYATAGFVANTGYCAADTGLARGFTRYKDFIFPRLTALRTAVLVNRALEGLRAAVYFTEDWLESAGLLRAARGLVRALDDDRKCAADLNNELIGWLARRPQPERPFFAFLNFYDAHYPYQLPPGRIHRFGVEPTDFHERYLIQQWGMLEKTTVSSNGVDFAMAAYDDCIADLDEQLGKLIDLLRQRGALDQTWLIVTSDHGESFGEHTGYFCHGTSLYDTELHVPLVIVPPSGFATGKVVNEPVCLRDLAATVVDLVGQTAGSPFPGSSLAPLWSGPASSAEKPMPSPSLAEVVPYDRRSGGDYWTAVRQLPPLASLKGREWSFIRRESDGREELFRVDKDSREERNLANDPAASAIRNRMDAALDGLTGGPLTPERFNR